MLFLFNSLVFAGSEPYLLPITRKDLTHTMVAAPWWRGEYPSPIIHVTSPKAKTVTIQGYETLRTLQKSTKVCTIPTGVYHPWSTGHSVDTFYSIISWVQYEILADVPDNGFKKGDSLENESYVAEGYCMYTHKSGTKIQNVQIFCDDLTGPAYKKIAHPTHSEEQWLYLNCSEGYKVFIPDSGLREQTGNLSGRICSYGEVSNNLGKCSTDP